MSGYYPVECGEYSLMYVPTIQSQYEPLCCPVSPRYERVEYYQPIECNPRPLSPIRRCYYQDYFEPTIRRPSPCSPLPKPCSPPLRPCSPPLRPCSPPPRCVEPDRIECPIVCNPVKMKYVMPCYRYEDGRIERYIPAKRGRLPVSAYRRNGVQDQIYGYRGAIRYLCSAPECPDSVYTVVEPIRKYHCKITKEVYPATKRKRECVA